MSGKFSFLYPTLKEIMPESECSELQKSIPEYAIGTLLRTGPGLFSFDDGFEVNHFLDGKYVAYLLDTAPKTKMCLIILFRLCHAN